MRMRAITYILRKEIPPSSFNQWILTVLILAGCAVGLFAQPLFRAVPASESGIHFNNQIEDTREHSILIYSNYYGGAGVAIADLDNDGLQDVYFAGNLVGDKLYRNTGNLKFQDVTEAAGIRDDGAWSSTVLIGDINNDGWQDIYVTCELYDDLPELRRNKLYLNQGNFKFIEAAQKFGLDNSERTRSATFIDFNRDGWLDIYLLNQPPNPGNYSKFSGQNMLRPEWAPRLFQNTGNGRFIDITDKAGMLKPCYPNSAVSVDYNNDGWQDIYVANDYESPDFLWRNNTDGTFTNVIDDAMRHISYYAMGVDAADINNDGLLDLMTLDMVAEDNYRQKANMGGMYPEQFWQLVEQGGHHQYMFNALHLNQGDGIFSDIAQMAGVSNTDWSWSNVIADFDNDGRKDIYVTNGLLRDIRNSDMAKKFPDYVRATIKAYLDQHPDATEVPILDIIDLQYSLDLHPSVPLANYAYRNEGDLKFTSVASEWGLDIPSFSNGCAYGDLDNDGDLDLVVNNINQEAFLFENNLAPERQNYFRIQLTDHKKNRPLLGTRIEILTCTGRQIHEVTSARGMYSSSEEICHFGLGSCDKVDELTITWPDGNISSVLDWPVNKLLKWDRHISIEVEPELMEYGTFIEVASSDLGIDFVHRENLFDDYQMQILLPHKMSRFGPALAIADVNGDGLEDFFIGGAHGQAGALYIQSQSEVFRTVNSSGFPDAEYEDVDAAFFDIDQDGDQDLYVVSGGNAYAPRNKLYLDRLYLNDGQGNFARDDRLPRILESGSCVRPFDFDGDGDLDLFVGARHSPWEYPSPTISRLLENVNGEMQDVTREKGNALIFLGMVTDAAWTDYNRDGKTDLIVVGEWMPITFFKNNGSGLVLDNSITIQQHDAEMNSSGWWHSIRCADLDGDGIDEIIVGNLGMNYKYKASADEPFEVFYDDFDGNGKKDIVLSYYNFGQRFPLRGKACSTQQIPEFAETFPSYDIFAGSDLEAVYGTDALESALHLQAETFASGMLSRKEDGTFEFRSLPAEAQVSCINSIVVDDFNNDGQEILVAGNNYHAEIETPRNDGGIGALIQMKDLASLNAVPATESGIYLPDDVRKVAPIKIGGIRHLLVACNDSAVKIYRY